MTNAVSDRAAPGRAVAQLRVRAGAPGTPRGCFASALRCFGRRLSRALARGVGLGLTIRCSIDRNLFRPFSPRLPRRSLDFACRSDKIDRRGRNLRTNADAVGRPNGLITSGSTFGTSATPAIPPVRRLRRSGSDIVPFSRFRRRHRCGRGDDIRFVGLRTAARSPRSPPLALALLVFTYRCAVDRPEGGSEFSFERVNRGRRGFGFRGSGDRDRAIDCDYRYWRPLHSRRLTVTFTSPPPATPATTTLLPLLGRAVLVRFISGVSPSRIERRLGFSFVGELRLGIRWFRCRFGDDRMPLVPFPASPLAALLTLSVLTVCIRLNSGCSGRS